MLIIPNQKIGDNPNKMNKIIYIFFILAIFSCKQKEEVKKQKTPIVDNSELIKIFEADQSDRLADNINWSQISKRDSLRRLRVYQLLDSSKILTSKDYRNAAMVFQHGNDSTDYSMAVQLMEKSIALDTTTNKWLLAAATDRYLLSKGEPQIYGTQYQKTGNEQWKLAEIDSTKISDAERMKFGIASLAELREKETKMNQKKLSQLFDSIKNVPKIIRFIKRKYKKASEYDLSEDGINSFGYFLMGKEMNSEALKIFKLNTRLFPKGYNSYDSYGECLLKIGDKKNAIRAYKKSLKLNPKNDNAKKVLETIK